jgi:large subunit ribosomal protein L4
MVPEEISEDPDHGEILQVPVRGIAGDDRGQVSVPAARLDERVRYRLLKEAVVMYAANRRAGTHETKTRSEVSGSTKKLYRQKGTGHARAGSRKSPLRRGGGVIFGPHMRDYSYSIHRKQRRLALRSALLSKFRDGQVLVVEGLQATEPKTRTVRKALDALGVEGSCLIGTKDLDKSLVLSVRNLPGVLIAPVREFNALDVLKVRKVVLTREAFEVLAAEGGAEEAPAEVADPRTVVADPRTVVADPRTVVADPRQGETQQ